MKKQLLKTSMLTSLMVLTVGCMGNKQASVPVPAPQPAPAVSKPVVPVVPEEPSGITLSNLRSSGISTISLMGEEEVYSENQPVRFVVDTKNQEGFLYILYVDDKGNTGLLYPNPKSPLTELSGKYIFPNDFGNMNIRATKDCAGCAEERTTIYALLSKEPIVDIKNITYNQLMSIFGGGSSGGAQSKGLSMDLSSGSSTGNSNVNVGKLEFVVQ